MAFLGHHDGDTLTGRYTNDHSPEGRHFLGGRLQSLPTPDVATQSALLEAAPNTAREDQREAEAHEADSDDRGGRLHAEPEGDGHGNASNNGEAASDAHHDDRAAEPRCRHVWLRRAARSVRGHTITLAAYKGLR